jgi:hypothetical protein
VAFLACPSVSSTCASLEALWRREVAFGEEEIFARRLIYLVRSFFVQSKNHRGCCEEPSRPTT